MSFSCVGLCARACVRACVCACACVWITISLFTQFVFTETIMATIMDSYKKLRPYKSFCLLALCACSYLVGFTCITQVRPGFISCAISTRTVSQHMSVVVVVFCCCTFCFLIKWHFSLSDSQVGASQRKFAKPELSYGLAVGGQTDSQLAKLCKSQI